MAVPVDVVMILLMPMRFGYGREYDDLGSLCSSLTRLSHKLRLANNHTPKAITASALPPSRTRPTRSRIVFVRTRKPSASSRKIMVQITKSRMLAIMPSAIAPVRRSPAPIIPRELA